MTFSPPSPQPLVWVPLLLAVVGCNRTDSAPTATTGASTAAASTTPAPRRLPARDVDVAFTLPGGRTPVVDVEAEAAHVATFFDESAKVLLSVEAFRKEDCATLLAMKPQPDLPLVEARKVGDRDALYVEGMSDGAAGGRRASVGYTVCTEAGPVEIVALSMDRATLEPADRQRALAIASSLTVARRTSPPTSWTAATTEDGLARAAFPGKPDLGKDPVGNAFAGHKIGPDAAFHVVCSRHGGDPRALGETWTGFRKAIVGTSEVKREREIIRDGAVGIEIDAARTEEPKLRARFLLLRRGGTFCAFSTMTPPDAPRDEDVAAFFGSATLLGR